MRFLSVNLDCFLIEFESLEETMAVHYRLKQAQHPHIKELIPAARSILIYFDPLLVEMHTLIQWISSQKISPNNLRQGKEIVIGVRYNGIDLNNVAEYLGISTDQVIRKHTNSYWQVAFIGFAPGFAYLTNPEQVFGSIPRLASPRKKVSAGAVGLAGEYSGIYPQDSPGGWQLIGQTDEILWDIHRQQPALLLPSDHVIFKDDSHNPTQISVPAQTFSQGQSIEKPAVLRVKNVGLQVLIQDEGRKNLAELGVGRAGAMDQKAFRQANLIVGNPKNAAVIEVLNGGVRLQVFEPTVMAVTGAETEVWVSYIGSNKVKVMMYQPIALDYGDEIYIAVPTAGIRNYIALRGGIAVEQVLKSASYDSLAELGTKPIQVGDEIHSAQLKAQPVSLNLIPIKLPKRDEIIEIDLVLGPRTDWFAEESLDLLFKQTWLVSTESNRIGLKLVGDRPLTRKFEQELPSEGCCTGALQIPPNGQPVLFMNDHPITGGYPVIAAVALYHLDLIAQIPAGCHIQFRKISDFMDVTKDA
ncbi:urea amidolyase family protein [Acinetobacter modestus]|uniref:5-oxoprolinase subunit B/C family protein n=1 Tax=Acinetobacter modestus TaxID=1776740 RepID=UPI002030FCB5|nr:urea amidolyase family protein [Acinetobacter modestus]MCM1959388.1 urea amidolyase family protein [Acinetobacter modestus]